MTKPISLADRLSGLNLRSRFGKSARARRRRVNNRWQLTAQISPLEERCMLSDLGGIPLPTPALGFVPPSKVMYQTDILKTITIHNNTDKPIFPFIEDVNVGINPLLNQLYDPHDYPFKPAAAPNPTEGQEYRLYAGYVEKVGGKDQNFLGIPPHASITLALPMVFWDAGTIQIVADSPATRQRFLEPLEPGGNKLGRPFLFNKDSTREAVVPATLTGTGIEGKTGMMLLYHSTNPLSKGVIPDAPSQLLEFTIRDSSMPTGIPEHPYFSNSVDYDISYINHLYLPVAMEANKAGNVVGYVGTFDTIDQFLPKVQAFAAGSILNGYFGGMGWPFYYTSDPALPIDKGALIKLVGAQNIFADNISASSYNLDRTMLSSSSGNQASGGVLKPTNNDYAEKILANYWFGWMNYYSTSWNQPIDPKLLQIMQHGGVTVKPVTITPDATKMWKLANGQTVSDAQFAKQFAYTVYQVMYAFSKDGNIVFTDPSHPALRSFLRDILGNTISEVVDPKTPAGVLLTQEVIAVLQGEPNTANHAPTGQPDYSLPLGPDGKYISYPTPAAPTDATLWAVGKYNLDPQVWFVHEYLGAYSYAFSVDDNYGNVLVDQSTGFQVAVGGDQGIPNKTPFKNGQ